MYRQPFLRFGPSTYTSARFCHEYRCSPYNVIGIDPWKVYFCDVDNWHVTYHSYESIFQNTKPPGPGGFNFFLESRIRAAIQKIHINTQFFFLIHILLLISYQNHHSTGNFRRKKISPGAVLSIYQQMKPYDLGVICNQNDFIGNLTEHNLGTHKKCTYNETSIFLWAFILVNTIAILIIIPTK